MKSFVYLLLISLTIVSCSKNDGSPENPIFGEWRLIKITSDGTNTPQISDYSNKNIIYNFTSDRRVQNNHYELIITGEVNSGYPNGKYNYFFGYTYLHPGPWDKDDKEFWQSYGISLPTLKRYRVKPISHFFINDTPTKCLDIAYAYFENKDDVITYKIYQPKADKKLKWRGNVGYDIWQGWTQLPDEGNLLIITKSYKDIMCIDDTCGYNSVSPQSESTHPKEYVVDQLKKRFKKIVVLFDNDFDNPDNPGRLNAIKFCEKYTIPMIEIPSEYESKDFSDLVKNHGVDTAKKVLTKLLKDGKYIK
mgnify:CR=1 FL=1